MIGNDVASDFFYFMTQSSIQQSNSSPIYLIRTLKCQFYQNYCVFQMKNQYNSHLFSHQVAFAISNDDLIDIQNNPAFGIGSTFCYQVVYEQGKCYIIMNNILVNQLNAQKEGQMQIQTFLQICRELKSAYFIINLQLYHKTIMNKRSKQVLQSQSNLNTLDSYFKNHDFHKKQPAKLMHTDLNQQSSINANTNSSSHRTEQVSTYYPQDQQCSQNAINFNQLKNMKNGKTEPNFINEENSNSYTCLQALPQKIKLPNHDDSPTKNFKKTVSEAIKDEIKKQSPQQQTTHKQKVKKAEANAKINLSLDSSSDFLQKMVDKNNQKVQQILRKQPLRIRFSQLLTDDLKYSIGHQHTKLLKLLRTVDNTIDFIKLNRQSKACFYTDLRNSLYQHNRMEFTQKHLQQLMFLDDTLFQLQWVINDKLKRHDLQIKAPPIKSQDQRIHQTRKKIVHYLLAMEVQYLAQRKIQKICLSRWSQGFDPNKYQIPTKSFPPHPNIKSAQISQLSQSQINAVPNPHLKNIMKSIRKQSQAQSLRSQDITSMIFSKKSNNHIKQILYQAIKQKQIRNAQFLRNQQGDKLQKSIVLSVCQQTMMVYMAKGVTNIFRQTLIDILNKKLRHKQAQIMLSLKMLTDSKQIDFLKQITTSNKAVVLQMNKTKFNQMMCKLKQLPQ